MNKLVKDIIACGVQGENKLDFFGNFIFLSHYTGEAWLLDHRENLALRLVDNYKPLPYKLLETDDSLSIEWKERFHIDSEIFIAIRDGKQSTFFNYPTAELARLIEFIRSE
jgi:hypothetical protein